MSHYGIRDTVASVNVTLDPRQADPPQPNSTVLR